MTYDWTQLTEKEITNLFLYGDINTPSDRINDAIIRPATDTKPIDVSMASFMSTGPGRFALGSQSALIETFFSTATDLSWMVVGRTYTKTELRSHLGLPVESEQINIKQVLLNDLAGDYWQRSYIWNSGLFRLSNDATFSIDAAGNRSIGNYSIRPFNDNFDFDGDGLIAGIANFLLEPEIDPWKIGRAVDIRFVDNGLPTSTYTNADYAADVVMHADHLVAGAVSVLTLPLGADAITAELWRGGITKSLYQGKAIIYGSNDAETLSESQLYDVLHDPLLQAAGLLNGVALIAGGGADTLNGGDNADYLQGGEGDDLLYGGFGNDTLVGGTGLDTYRTYASEGIDTIEDIDGQGKLMLGSLEIKGSTGLAPTKWKQLGTDTWVDSENGITYSRSVVNGETRLFIHKADSNVLVKGWSDGALGIVLGAGSTTATPPPTTQTYTGNQRAPLIGIEIDTDIQPGAANYGTYKWSVTGWAADGTLAGGVAQANFNDVIYGSAGADCLDGLGGNDALDGGAGTDRIDGGAGDDLIGGGAGSDLIYGGTGNDEILSATGLAVPQRHAPSDVWSPPPGTTGWITGSTWGVYQNPGNTYTVNGGGSIFQDDAPDVVYAGDGNDQVTGGRGDDFIDGGAGNDKLRGHGGNDVINSGMGDDTIEGDGTTVPGFYETIPASQHGDDILIGGAGKDTIWGGGGHDFLLGGTEDDLLYGEAGDDVLDGGTGSDYLAGGAGDDTYLNITAEDTVFDIEGDNTIVLATASLGAGGLSATVQTGNDGSQYMQLAVTLDTGDALKLENPFFADGSTSLQFTGGDTLDLEALVGQSLSTPLNLRLDDAGGRVYGGAGADNLYGGAGADTLVGHNGDDTLIGGAGNDVLDGGTGKDILIGGAGNDTYLGVAGGDEIFDIEGDSIIVLTVASLGAGGLSASLQTNADGSQYMQLAVALDTGDALKLDSPFFADGSNTLQFTGGDTLDLETLVGESLATPLNLQLSDSGGRVYGGAGNDRLTGGAGNDNLIGHDGNDTLLGGAGDDVLDGGAGNDVLNGGQGNDRYSVSGGRDTLIDDQPGAAGLGATLLLNAQPGDLAVALQTEANGSQTLSLTLANGSGVDIRNGFLGVVGSITLADGSTQNLHDLLNTYANQNLSLNGTVIDDAVYGGAGNDVLAGLTGGDVLYGGKGDDTLDGGGGADTLRGEAGNDTLYGGAGVDIYVFGIGDGNDVVIAPAQTDLNADVLQMGQGINAGDLAYFQLADGSLLLRINGTQDSVKLEGWFNTGSSISTVRFADGTEVNAAAISALAVAGYGGTALDDHLTGTALNDHILGYGGNDVLSGGAGDDLLEGGAGADTYLFGWSSSGADTLVDTSAEVSTIALTEGADLLDLKHSRVGDTLLISLRGTDAALTLKDYFTTTQSWSIRDESGAEVSVTDWLALATAPADVNSLQDDYLDEVRAQFSKKFVVDRGYKRVGQDTVESISAGTYGITQYVEHLSLQTYRSDAASIYRQSDSTGPTQYSSVEITQAATGGAVGGQVFISLDSILASGAGGISTNGLVSVYGPKTGSSSVVVGGGQTLVGFMSLGVGAAQPDAIAHYFNTTWTDNTYLEQINGGNDDNVISGFQQGSYGPRTAVTLIDGGGGNDTIYASGSIGRNSGSYWDRSTELGGFVYGNSGDDSLYGQDLRDTLVGGTGSDFMDGGYSADTYVVLPGDLGADVIWDSGAPVDPFVGGHVDTVSYSELRAAYYAYLGISDPSAPGVVLPPLPAASDFTVLSSLASLGAIPLDTIKFMGGMHPSDLTFAWSQRVQESKHSSGLGGFEGVPNYSQTMHAVLNLFWAAGESIGVVIPNSTDLIGTGIERFKFDDGTVLSMADILGLAGPHPTLNPQDDDNMIQGGTADDAIDGEGGNDLLYGGSGNDSLAGSAGNDALDGGDGDDTLDGGAGTDSLIGSTGNDSYVFGIGYGQDTVQDIDVTTGNIDTVWMNSRIAPADVSVSRTATQLVLSLNANDALHIDWNPAVGAGIEQVSFDDGTVWDAAMLLTLANHAPTVTAPLNSQAATENAAFSFALPQGVFADTDVGLWDTLTYTATLASGNALPGWLAFDAATCVFSGMPANGDVGALALRVTATDTLGAAVFTDFNLNVANANVAPVVASPIVDQSVNEGSVFSFAIPLTTFTDANVGDELNYSVASADGSTLPAWLTYNAATRTIAGIPIDSAAGDYTLRVTATDTVGATAYDDFILSVADTLATVKNGTSGAETLNGTSYKDMLNGLGGNDVLYGYAGDDTLDGDTGNDTMVGGTGDDTYIVDSATDIITENANEGLDSVQSGVTYTLAANVENLTLTGTAAINGTGNALDNNLTGNSAVNTLTGGAGNDRLDGKVGADKMLGGTGDDTYVVDVSTDVITENANEGTDTVETGITYTLGTNIENLTLTGTSAINGTGNTLNNVITGNNAANTLSGGTGADTMIGGAGDDTYVVDNTLDVVTESLYEGTDLIQSRVTYALGSNVENLTLTGTTAINGAGNALDNILTGNRAANTLVGGAGNDHIDGKTGADTMLGGTGNDTYVVNTSADLIIENIDEGVDTVESSVTYTLSANLENLTLTGISAVNGNANALDNLLKGNGGANKLEGAAGNDILDGGAGADTLTGGIGNDIYLMGRGYAADTVVENDATAGNIDIAQFLSGVANDQIWFQHIGNNLEASIIGTSDKLVVKDWYLGTAYHVEQFKTTDGAKTLLDSNVQNLVNAMASFAPPTAGQTTLPTTYQPSLAPVIAANWQ